MAKPQRVTFLRANLKDQPGTLFDIMKDLKAKKIALKSLWGYGKSEGAQISSRSQKILINYAMLGKLQACLLKKESDFSLKATTKQAFF